LAVLVPHTSVFAGQAVNTSTLNPPLPLTTDYACQSDGANVICRATRSFSISSVSALDFEGPGWECAGMPMYESVLDSQNVTRFYTYEPTGYNGPGYYLTRRTTHETEVQTLSLSPTIANPTVSWISHLNYSTVLATPGDFSTATTTLTGLDSMANAPGFGLLFHQSGQVIQDSNDNLVSVHGPRQLDLDFSASIQAVCTALGAP